MTDLSKRSCADVTAEGPLAVDALAALTGALDEGWSVADQRLTRRFKFKNFSRALMFTNAVGAVAEDQGHHPDLALGWGYVEVSFTTHDAGGLTEKDFICAARVDALGLAG